MDIMTESTLQKIYEKMQVQNAYLSLLARGLSIDSYEGIAEIVKAGAASKIFAVGDQINAGYNYSGTAYTWPFDIVDFPDVELENGSTVPGMALQAHYCSIEPMPFDEQEAFYYTKEGMGAGKYFFTVGTTWGKYTKDDIIEFTLESDVAAGSQLYFDADGYSTDLDDTTISVYASPSDTEPAQTATLSKVSSSTGAGLGTLASTNAYTEDTGLNNLQRATRGYNRWSQSACRQWLNSAADKSAWWEAKNPFDRPPTQHGQYAGFMAGFGGDFLGILKPVRVTTALNTVSDSAAGETEYTFDTFFPAALEQINAAPQLSGAEGDAWEYWKQVTGSDEAAATGNTYWATYALNAQTTAQNVRLRSADRGLAYTVWYVGTGGSLNSTSAYAAFRYAPACVIC